MGTFLKLLETLKSNLELVRSSERGGVVEHLDPQKRDDRHDDKIGFDMRYLRRGRSVMKEEDRGFIGGRGRTQGRMRETNSTP